MMENYMYVIHYTLKNKKLNRKYVNYWDCNVNQLFRLNVNNKEMDMIVVFMQFLMFYNLLNTQI